MTATYCVKVFVGPYSYTTRDTDAAGYGLADPLTVTWSLPDSDMQPLVQPNPTTASFTVVASSYAGVSALELGQSVSIRYWSVTNPAAGDAPLFDFNGKVVDLALKPHDLGVSAVVACADYLTAIAERTVGLANWPQETVDARCRRILTEAGVSIPADLWETDTDPSSPATIAARTAGDVNALEILTHTLDQYLTTFAGFPNANGRGFIHQVTTPAAPTFSSGISTLDNTNGPYVLGSVTKAIAYDPPLRVVNLAGVHTLQGSASAGTPSTVTIDASYIERDVSWAQRKGTAVNSWQVTGAYTPAQTAAWAGLPNGPVWGNSDTELVNASDGLALANLYLPAVKPVNTLIWTADTFTWRIGRDPSTTWRLPVLGRVLSIYDIDSRWQVTGDPWWVGMPTAVTFTLAGGDPQAIITVIPWLVDPVQAISPITLADPGWNGPVIRTNLSPASSMEGQHGWNNNTATLTIDATQNWTPGGTRSLKVTTPSTENWGYYPMDGAVSLGVTHPLRVIGNKYSARIMVYSLTAQTLCLTDYGTANVQGPSVAVPATTWTALTLTGWTAGTNVFLSVRNPNRTTIIGTLYLDGWIIIDDPTAAGVPYYFDGAGSSGGPAGNVYAWTGTANNSPSTEQTPITIDTLATADSFDDYKLAKGPAV